MPSFVIGCAGRARHGKGSTAEFVKEWANSNSIPSQIISLADPLKDFLSLLVGRSEPFRGNSTERYAPVPELPWSRLEPQILAEAKALWPEQDFSVNPTGRQLMQLFGTEVVRRHFCADAWVIMTGNRARQFNGITIVDDMRFTNEARLRRLEPGVGIVDVLFKIVRPDIPNINHPSEDAVDTIPLSWMDRVFDNTGDLASLRERVMAWLTTALDVDDGEISAPRNPNASGPFNNQESNR